MLGERETRALRKGLCVALAVLLMITRDCVVEAAFFGGGRLSFIVVCLRLAIITVQSYSKNDGTS